MARPTLHTHTHLGLVSGEKEGELYRQGQPSRLCNG